MLFLELACLRDGNYAPLMESQRPLLKEWPGLEGKTEEELAELKFIPFGASVKITDVSGLLEGPLDFSDGGQPKQWDDAVCYTHPSKSKSPNVPTTTIMLHGGQFINVIGTFGQIQNAVNARLAQMGQQMRAAQAPQLVMPPPGDLRQMPRKR